MFVLSLHIVISKQESIQKNPIIKNKTVRKTVRQPCMVGHQQLITLDQLLRTNPIVLVPLPPCFILLKCLVLSRDRCFIITPIQQLLQRLLFNNNKWQLPHLER